MQICYLYSNLDLKDFPEPADKVREDTVGSFDSQETSSPINE